jgi:hypothetical protein
LHLGALTPRIDVAQIAAGLWLESASFRREENQRACFLLSVKKRRGGVWRNVGGGMGGVTLAWRCVSYGGIGLRRAEKKKTRRKKRRRIFRRRGIGNIGVSLDLFNLKAYRMYLWTSCYVTC